MLIDLLMIPEERFITVNDKETISLGDRTMEFIYAPWVHWPETMLTYLREDMVLFPCDLFGSHLATTDLYVTDEGQVYEAAKRYYAEIMMPFRTSIEKHLEKIKGYQIDIIALAMAPYMINLASFWRRIEVGSSINPKTSWSCLTSRCMAAPKRWWNISSEL